MFDVFFPYQLLKQISKLHILHLISKDILLNILYFFLFYNLRKIYDMLQLLLLIILLMVLLFILVKDKISILKIIGITLISSGVLITLLAVAIKVLIKTTIYYINLSKVTSIILSNFLIISTIFILSGLFSYIMYKILRPKEIVKV